MFDILLFMTVLSSGCAILDHLFSDLWSQKFCLRCSYQRYILFVLCAFVVIFFTTKTLRSQRKTIKNIDFG